MSVETSIREALVQTFRPQHLDVSNESSNHRVAPGSETHFKVVIVTGLFEGERLIARHRRVNTTLAEFLAGGVHALALHTYTPEEWRARIGDAPDSPPCAGGDKAPT